MIMKMYAIYDRKAEMYNRPYYANTDGQAAREVLAAMRDPQVSLSQYPADYSLWHVGQFDDATGIVCGDKPQKIVELEALVSATKES